jgi:hypothetical protein
VGEDTERSTFIMFATITSILIALSLLLGGTGAAVYASQDSQPGDMLYTVKTTGEDFQFRLASNDDMKVQLALKFAARRVSEALNMAENGQQIHGGLINRLELNLNTALRAAAEMDEPELGLERIKAEIQIQKRDCDRIQGNIPDAEELGLNMLQHKLEHKIRVVEKGLEEPSTFRHVFRLRFGQEAEDELLGVADEQPEPVDDPLVDEPTGEEITPPGPGYGDQPGARNQAGEGHGESQQSQNGEVQSYGPGPGDPQTEPESPYGPNDSPGSGPGEQYGNPEPGNPEPGNPDSGSGGSTGSGNQDSGSGSKKP